MSGPVIRRGRGNFTYGATSTVGEEAGASQAGVIMKHIDPGALTAGAGAEVTASGDYSRGAALQKSTLLGTMQAKSAAANAEFTAALDALERARRGQGSDNSADSTAAGERSESTVTTTIFGNYKERQQQAQMQSAIGGGPATSGATAGPSSSVVPSNELLQIDKDGNRISTQTLRQLLFSHERRRRQIIIVGDLYKLSRHGKVFLTKYTSADNHHENAHLTRKERAGMINPGATPVGIDSGETIEDYRGHHPNNRHVRTGRAAAAGAAAAQEHVVKPQHLERFYLNGLHLSTPIEGQKVRVRYNTSEGRHNTRAAGINGGFVGNVVAAWRAAEEDAIKKLQEEQIEKIEQMEDMSEEARQAAIEALGRAYGAADHTPGESKDAENENDKQTVSKIQLPPLSPEELSHRRFVEEIDANLILQQEKMKQEGLVYPLSLPENGNDIDFFYNKKATNSNPDTEGDDDDEVIDRDVDPLKVAPVLATYQFKNLFPFLRHAFLSLWSLNDIYQQRISVRFEFGKVYYSTGNSGSKQREMISRRRRKTGHYGREDWAEGAAFYDTYGGTLGMDNTRMPFFDFLMQLQNEAALLYFIPDAPATVANGLDALLNGRSVISKIRVQNPNLIGSSADPKSAQNVDAEEDEQPPTQPGVRQPSRTSTAIAYYSQVKLYFFSRLKQNTLVVRAIYKSHDGTTNQLCINDEFGQYEMIDVELGGITISWLVLNLENADVYKLIADKEEIEEVASISTQQSAERRAKAKDASEKLAAQDKESNTSKTDRKTDSSPPSPTKDVVKGFTVTDTTSKKATQANVPSADSESANAETNTSTDAASSKAANVNRFVKVTHRHAHPLEVQFRAYQRTKTLLKMQEEHHDRTGANRYLYRDKILEEEKIRSANKGIYLADKDKEITLTNFDNDFILTSKAAAVLGCLSTAERARKHLMAARTLENRSAPNDVYEKMPLVETLEAWEQLHESRRARYRELSEQYETGSGKPRHKEERDRKVAGQNAFLSRMLNIKSKDQAAPFAEPETVPGGPDDRYGPSSRLEWEDTYDLTKIVIEHVFVRRLPDTYSTQASGEDATGGEDELVLDTSDAFTIERIEDALRYRRQKASGEAPASSGSTTRVVFDSPAFFRSRLCTLHWNIDSTSTRIPGSTPTKRPLGPGGSTKKHEDHLVPLTAALNCCMGIIDRANIFENRERQFWRKGRGDDATGNSSTTGTVTQQSRGVGLRSIDELIPAYPRRRPLNNASHTSGNLNASTHSSVNGGGGSYRDGYYYGDGNPNSNNYYLYGSHANNQMYEQLGPLFSPHPHFYDSSDDDEIHQRPNRSNGREETPGRRGQQRGAPPHSRPPHYPRQNNQSRDAETFDVDLPANIPPRALNWQQQQLTQQESSPSEGQDTGTGYRGSASHRLKRYHNTRK